MTVDWRLWPRHMLAPIAEDRGLGASELKDKGHTICSESLSRGIGYMTISTAPGEILSEQRLSF